MLYFALWEFLFFSSRSFLIGLSVALDLSAVEYRSAVHAIRSSDCLMRGLSIGV